MWSYENVWPAAYQRLDLAGIRRFIASRGRVYCRQRERERDRKRRKRENSRCGAWLRGGCPRLRFVGNARSITRRFSSSSVLVSPFLSFAQREEAEEATSAAARVAFAPKSPPDPFVPFFPISGFHLKEKVYLNISNKTYLTRPSYSVSDQEFPKYFNYLKIHLRNCCN